MTNLTHHSNTVVKPFVFPISAHTYNHNIPIPTYNNHTHAHTHTQIDSHKHKHTTQTHHTHHTHHAHTCNSCRMTSTLGAGNLSRIPYFPFCIHGQKRIEMRSNYNCESEVTLPKGTVLDSLTSLNIKHALKQW